MRHSTAQIAICAAKPVGSVVKSTATVFAWMITAGTKFNHCQPWQANSWMTTQHLVATTSNRYRVKRTVSSRPMTWHKADHLPSYPMTRTGSSTMQAMSDSGSIFLSSTSDNNLVSYSDQYTPPVGSMQDQTILITGGTTGLGLESAKRLAVSGARIVVTARSHAKGLAAVHDVQSYLKRRNLQHFSENNIQYKLLDLDSLQSVRDAVASWSDLTSIDVLLNNAGIMALPNRELTVDRIERQIQSNHLGHFLLTALLLPKFRPNQPVRIINVSSTAHQLAARTSGGVDWDYIWTGGDGRVGQYGAWKSYSQSKLANILFTRELQRRIDDVGLPWMTATLHPGVVNTDLSRYMMGLEKFEQRKQDPSSPRGNILERAVGQLVTWFLKTPQQGASTQIYLASGANGENIRGKYYIDGMERPPEDPATDMVAAARLWKESEDKAGVSFNLQTLLVGQEASWSNVTASSS